MWAEKNSHVLKQTTASESVKSSSLYFEFVLTNWSCQKEKNWSCQKENKLILLERKQTDLVRKKTNWSCQKKNLILSERKVNLISQRFVSIDGGSISFNQLLSSKTIHFSEISYYKSTAIFTKCHLGSLYYFYKEQNFSEKKLVR